VSVTGPAVGVTHTLTAGAVSVSSSTTVTGGPFDLTLAAVPGVVNGAVPVRRDITVTVSTGPTRHPATSTGPTRHPTVTAGPRRWDH
jgi:hypothetical protein